MVIVCMWEGLGNQMFQYAYARTLAKQGIDVSLDVGKTYDRYYERSRTHTLREVRIENFAVKIPAAEEAALHKYAFIRRGNKIETVLYQLSVHGRWPFVFLEEGEPGDFTGLQKLPSNCYIKGWFQDALFPEKVRGELLREFVPKKKIKVSERFRKMMEDSHSAAIHIRRGDYVKSNNVLPPTYYYEAMKKMESLIREPRYLVFSDDPAWVKEHLNFGESAVFVDEAAEWEDYEQLFLMSRCSHQITANSTFSWWGAWLNRNPHKTVIMPKKYLARCPGLKIEGSFAI